MKSKNRKLRHFFRLLVLLLLVVLAAALTLKLYGCEISDWVFAINSILLLVCGIMFSNYNQAVKEDDKFGSRGERGH